MYFKTETKWLKGGRTFSKVDPQTKMANIVRYFSSKAFCCVSCIGIQADRAAANERLECTIVKDQLDLLAIKCAFTEKGQ